MKIIVPVKRVVDYNVKIRVKPDGSGVELANVKMSMNPFDEIAVEEALRLKEAGKAEEVIAVSIGPAQALETIRTALAMGADKGIHINDPEAEGSDALATAKILAAAIKEIPFELVIAGHRAVDEVNYQVAAAVAEILGIPQISMVVKEELLDGKIRCERTIEGGTVTVEAALPVLFTT